MKNPLVRYFCFLGLINAVLPFSRAQQCLFRIDMHDSEGDGWSNALLTVGSGPASFNLSLVDNIGGGADSTVYFTVNNGAALRLYWTPGSYDAEVSVSLYNNDGDLLYQVTNPAAGQLFQQTVSCVACLKPLDVQIDDVFDTRVKLRWSPGAGAGTPVGWRVIYGPSGFVPGPGAGDTLYVTMPKATVAGLQKKTKYDAYVQQDCGNNTSGGLSGPFAFETYRSDDVGISAVRNPPNGSCQLGEETITVVLSNFGAKPQALIPVNYSVDGIPAGILHPGDGFFTGVLGKDSSAVFQFKKTFNFSSSGEYRIAAWTEMTGDENAANDTFYLRVANHLRAPYREDFETWNGGWAVDTVLSTAPSWQWGMPASPQIPAAAQGQNAWVTNLNGDYNPAEMSYLSSPCFDFSGLTEDPVIEFALVHFNETYFDGGWLEMSSDDANTWKKVGVLNDGLNWYNVDNFLSDLGPVWSDASKGWLSARRRLDGAAGQPQVRLRFAFSSDDLNESDGMGIDDIRIYEPVAGDLAGIAVSTTADGADCGLEHDAVTFRIANFGSKPQSFFNLAYSLNGAAPVTENVGFTMVNPGAVFEYTFDQTFDSRDGVFAIRCWATLPNDQNPANDTTTAHLVNHLPNPVPLRENFEAGFPDEWISEGFVTNDHHNLSQVLAFRLNDAEPEYSTEFPRVGFISPTDTLSFEYRITDFDGNGTLATDLSGGTAFDVQISTDCGLSFQTVFTIDQQTHVPGVGMQKVQLGLIPFAGHAVTVRITGIWGAGDFFFDLDNINIGPVPHTPVRDLPDLRQFSLTPNPTTGLTRLQAVFGRHTDVQVTVLDLLGRVLWQKSAVQMRVIAENLDMSGVADGVYFVRLTAGGWSAVRKMVKGG